MIIYVEILREDLFRTLRRSLFARCPDRLSPLIVGVLVRMCFLFQKFDERRLANSIGSPSLPALGLKWSTSSARIEAAFETSDQRRYHVPCGACGHEQALRWAQIKWDKSESGNHLPETATYRCESCGAKWNDDERLAAVRLGTWRAARPFDGTAGFHLSALYSPWVKLAELATMFLQAKDYPEQLKTFVKLSLGETYEEKGEQFDETACSRAASTTGRKFLRAWWSSPAGVDTQDDRLEVELCGWDSSEQCWSLDFRTIRGDPSTGTPWRDLDALLLEQRRRATASCSRSRRRAATRWATPRRPCTASLASARRGACGRRKGWADRGRSGPGSRRETTSARCRSS